MTRDQLEHVIRAACAIAADTELIIVGSQAVLGQFPNAPQDLLVSMEADVWPKHHRERAELIEGAIGELSMFHETFGYYANGLADMTPVLPHGWEGRLVRVEGPGTAGNVGWSLDVHDLALSKYVAARPKDLTYNRVLLEQGLVDLGRLLELLEDMPLDEAGRSRVEGLIRASAPPGSR